MQKITILEQKRIILGVTGSIAVYKAVDLASKLTQAGALVDVIMTDSAQQFVTPLTFQSVTGRPVYTDLWQAESSGGLGTHIAHVGLGEGADLMLIAPITAHSIAKLAHGLADNLLSVTALTARCPVMIAPAMDGGMYEHPATMANIETLLARGVHLIQPDEGRFASGLVGLGRLPDTPTLMGHTRRVLGRDGLLKGRKVIVSAGGSRESIDPVRYVTNHSSGKQGYAIAQSALDAGAKEVILVSASQHLETPIGATLIPVASAQEMHDAIIAELNNTDLLVMSAAVADYRPATVADQKIKKTGDADDGLHLDLVRTPDILMSVKARREQHGYPLVVVGFAAESQNLLENATSKLKRKGLDLIVANDITARDAGFATDTNRVVMIDAQGQHPLELSSKAVVGETIIQRIAYYLEDIASE